MRYALHIGAPLAVGVLVYFGQMSLDTVDGRLTYTMVVGTLAKSMAVVGAWVAASAFDRGDYLRRAWLLIVANYSFITVNFLLAGTAKPLLLGLGAVHLPGLEPSSLAASYVRSIGVIIGNGLGVLATLMLARAWSVAGLEPASGAVRLVVAVSAVVLAGLIVGRASYGDVVDLMHERSMGAAISVASDFGDFISFSLIAPMLLTALALRGGVLVWPWALYTSSQLAWMLFDAVMSVPATKSTRKHDGRVRARDRLPVEHTGRASRSDERWRGRHEQFALPPFAGGVHRGERDAGRRADDAAVGAEQRILVQRHHGHQAVGVRRCAGGGVCVRARRLSAARLAVDRRQRYGFITFNSFLFGGNNSRGSFFGWHPNLLGLNPVLAGQLNWLSVILGNLLAVVGAVMLARAWSVAGLERSGSPAQRWLVIIGAVAIAAALTGGPIAHSITNGLHNGFGLRFFDIEHGVRQTQRQRRPVLCAGWWRRCC